MHDYQKRKERKRWFRAVEIVAISVPVVIIVISLFNNILKDHYDFALDSRRLEIEAENVELERQKIRTQAYERYKTELKQVARPLSLLQIQVVDDVQFCQRFKKLPLKEQKIEQANFQKELKERAKKQKELKLQLVEQYALLKFSFGAEAREKALHFVQMVNKYPDPCAENIPSREDWIRWQNNFFDELIKYVKKQYPDVSHKRMHVPTYESENINDVDTYKNILT